MLTVCLFGSVVKTGAESKAAWQMPSRGSNPRDITSSYLLSFQFDLFTAHLRGLQLGHNEKTSHFSVRKVKLQANGHTYFAWKVDSRINSKIVPHGILQ